MPSLIGTLLPHRLAEDRDEAVKGLVAALRADGAVPEDLARLLADMLDPDGKTAWRLDVRQRGKRGPASRPLSREMRAAGEHAYAAIEERGAKYDPAANEAAAQFEISASSVKTALRKIREEQAILDEVEQETGERPFRLFSS